MLVLTKEVRFNNKDINTLSKEEALINYKRNTALISKIFTVDPNNLEPIEDLEYISSLKDEEVSEKVNTMIKST